MAGVPRLSVTNRIQAPATVLSVSSEQTSAPRSWLKDQLRSKTWRSKAGWTIVAGLNDKIDFNRGGVKVATLTPGTYATAALLAAEIVTQLEAVDATPVWACSYSGSTFKFTVSSDLAFTLLFGTGANLVTSAHVDLGFATADTGSAVSHTAGSTAYQSRHAITADLGAAASITVAIVINHNAGTGGTFTFQADAASLAAVGYGDAATPDFSQVLAGDGAIRIAFFSDPNRRYLRLLVNDVQNSLGYSEVGIWFAGPYIQPTISYAIGFEKSWEELSQIATAMSGAHFQDERARRPVWSLSWSEAPEADRASLAAAFALVPVGKCFFFAFDAVTTPTDTEYVFVSEGVSETLSSGLYFDIPVALSGALG
jgi:hypothetical protein